MSTRNIKDAKDLTTGELIYFKSHAQATFMSDGCTVEEVVSEISAVDTSNLATKDELAQKQDIISDIDTIRREFSITINKQRDLIFLLIINKQPIYWVAYFKILN